MKKVFYVILFMISWAVIWPEDINQANFLNELSEKEYATLGDCVISFCLLNNISATEDFKSNLDALREYCPYVPKKKNADNILTLGDFSLFAIEHLNIKSGLFYLATKTGRYALRELMQIALVPVNSSELEKISGIRLIGLLQKVDEYANTKNEL